MLSKDLVAASAEPLILSILSRREDYGYSIIQEVRRLSNDKIQWTDGMLYPVLHRLEQRGCLGSRWEESESGRRRKYYFVTSKGRKALKTGKEQWAVVQLTLSKIWKEKYA